MKAKKIEYVHGVGLDTKKIMDASVDKEEKRKEIGVPNDGIVLLSAGELNQNKNHETIVKAVAKVADKNIHYVIAGRGGKMDYLKSLAQTLNISDNIHILGFRSDVVELYKAADICVFPSIREGLGKAALEGMAAGLPLIASNNRGTKDYAVNRENALLCDCFSVEQFADAIKTLSNDKKLRETMGAQNIEKVKPFDFSNALCEMERIYFDIN